METHFPPFLHFSFSLFFFFVWFLYFCVSELTTTSRGNEWITESEFLVYDIVRVSGEGGREGGREGRGEEEEEGRKWPGIYHVLHDGVTSEETMNINAIDEYQLYGHCTVSNLSDFCRD